jgi:LuxR family maltose regulon positive regulatory protein
MDGDRRWFRYHRLFAEFLRADLSRDDELAQHRRAAAWCAANGHARDAVTHALAAEDWLAAADLIGAAAVELLRAGEVTTLAAWLAALPEALIQAHEELSAHRALAALLTGQLAAAVRWAAPLADAPGVGFAAPRGGREWTIAAWLASVQGWADLMRFARQADALTADDDPLYKTLALITLELAQNVEGDVAGSDASFRRAYELSAAAGQPFAALGVLANLCFNLLEEGRFRAADALAQEALARYVDRRGRPLPVLGILYAPLAVLAYARDDLAQAETFAREGLALCRRLFSRAILGGDAEMTLALILFDRGERDRAHVLPAEARREAASAGVTVVAARLALQDALLALRAGDPAPAEQYLARRGDARFAGSRADGARVRLVEARILLARGRLAEARAALANLGRAVATTGHAARLVQIRVWEAAAAADAGDRPAALEFLRKALRLAAPEGYRRAFLDAGDTLVGLLRQARNAAPDFVDDLLARFAAHVPAAAPALPAAPTWLAPSTSALASAALVEPLSEREREILGLIAAGYSNQQIADRLVITAGTAKWHVHNVLQKLGVTSRSQASARARESGLL